MSFLEYSWFEKLDQKSLSSFHRDSSKICDIRVQQIRHKNTWQRTKWSYLSSFCPRIPWQMLCHAGDELCLITKSTSYINIEKKGRAFLLSQYQNKECCKHFCATLSVSTVAAFRSDECCFCLLFHEITSDRFWRIHRKLNAETYMGLSMAHIFYV